MSSLRFVYGRLGDLQIKAYFKGMTRVWMMTEINTKKTLEVLSLLRPIVHDTSETAIIT